VKPFRNRDKSRHSVEQSLDFKPACTIQVPLLVEMAIEVWRVAGRARKLQEAAKREDPAIGFSIEKIHHILKEMGVEIKDPAGEAYHEGMVLDVLTFDCTPGELQADKIVQETVSPAVYFNGKLIKMAKVIVANAGGRQSDAEDHN
jgi:hypothetical protein